ncbi:hypothetical protein AVEN_2743-1 [Araneus ventricosus]|uniref:Uncharacterized protein n=1 Tax=Araneus ventricosus TaxID=182803 RepID=A0A4Y2GN31_ARAVE|nr:hypothetical protein AVEN_2743-1 [Araneus ventricosus]
MENKLKSADRLSRQEFAQNSPATKRYWALWDSLHLKDGALYRKWGMMMEAHVDGNSFSRRAEFKKFCKRLMSASGRHFGIMETLHRTNP